MTLPTWSRYVLVALAGLGSGTVIARYTLPPKVTERVVTKVETVEVVKWKEKVVVEQGPVRVVTKTVTVPGPQGSTVTVEKIVEKGKVVTVHDNSGSSQQATSSESSASKITDRRPWAAVGLGGYIAPTTGKLAWDANVTFRVLGPLWVGAGGLKADTYYLGPVARLEF